MATKKPTQKKKAPAKRARADDRIVAQVLIPVFTVLSFVFLGMAYWRYS